MARFNEILTGRHNRFLQKYFSMKGGPPSAQLSTEIQPGVQLFTGVENRWLEQWNRFANSPPAMVAVAGNNVQCRLVNDAGTNVIAVVEKLWIWTSLADELDICLQHQAVTVAGHVPTLSVNPSISLDGRLQGSSGATLGGAVLSFGSQLTSNTNSSIIARYQLPANGSVDVILNEDHQIPLISLPNTGEFLQIQSSVVTNTIRVFIVWRERFLEDSERG